MPYEEAWGVMEDERVEVGRRAVEDESGDAVRLSDYHVKYSLSKYTLWKDVLFPSQPPQSILRVPLIPTKNDSLKAPTLRHPTHHH